MPNEPEGNTRSDADARTTRQSGAPTGPRQADARRAALLDAAEALFIEKGVEATTIDEIAARAGVAKGTVYHYFAAKTALVEGLTERFSDAFQHRITTAVERRPDDDWAGRLTAWLEAAVRAYFDMQALHDVVFHGPEMPTRHAMGEVPCVQDLAALLSAGTAAQAWSVEEPQATAVIMFHGLHGVVDEAILAGQTPDEAAGLLAKLYLRMAGAGR